VYPQGKARLFPGWRTNRATRKVVVAALSGYGIQPTAVSKVEVMRRGPVHVYKVALDSGRHLALRVYPDQALPAPEPGARPILRHPMVLAAQLGWMLELRSAGLQIPTPIPTKDGGWVGTVRMAVGPKTTGRRPVTVLRSCTLTTWLPGVEPDPTPEHYARVGELVATVHGHGDHRNHRHHQPLPIWDWHWVFGPRAPVWRLGPTHFTVEEMTAITLAADRLRRDLDGLAGDVGIIHRDVRPANLVFDREAPGLIDFDSSGVGYRLHDLVLLKVGLRARHGQVGPELWRATLGGYRAVRSLPDQLPRLLANFSALHDAAMLNRQLNFRSIDPNDPSVRPPEFLHAAARRLSEYAVKLQLLWIGDLMVDSLSSGVAWAV
jgi:Ser/Thr protein kinase RdoA (MazF antagonist)